MGSAILIIFMLWDGVFTFGEALFCVFVYAVYIIYIAKQHVDKAAVKKHFKLKWIWILLLSVAGIYIGAKFSVSSVIALTNHLGFPDTSLIAITVIALGTSLPELMVSVVAAIKKNFDMSIGNIIGSNIFNTFMVIGIPGLFTTLNISSSTLYSGIPLMILATLLISFAALKNKVSWSEGVLYLALYAFFIFKVYAGF